MIIEPSGSVPSHIVTLQRLEEKNAIQRLDRISLNKEKTVMVKFNFGNRSLVPSGIPTRFSFNPLEADRIQTTVANARGEGMLAAEGRVRPGRVDTATAMMEANRPICVPFVRVGLANNGFFPNWCCWYQKDQKVGSRKPTGGCIVDLRFVHKDVQTDKDRAFELSRESVGGLRALSRMVWQACYIYDNFGSITVNLAGLIRNTSPKLAVAVRDHQFNFLNLEELIGEEK